ncbi:MAG: class I SAM-dependent rRNA methyltransferase [Aureliella sp.]
MTDESGSPHQKQVGIQQERSEFSTDGAAELVCNAIDPDQCHGLVREGRRRRVRMQRDLVRDIKRGHAWIYSAAIEPIKAPAGTVVELWDQRGQRAIAAGIYDGDHPIPVRICSIDPEIEVDGVWLARRLMDAWTLRQRFFDSRTTGFRWVAGEGDGVPGMILDVYDHVAVMKLDGGAPEAFYLPKAIGNWIVENTSIETVVLRTRQRGQTGAVIAGADLPHARVALTGEQLSATDFLENGLRFQADVFAGQKTGFFLDQRDNRELIRRLAKGKSVLNLYSFSGGFSVAAGQGGATQVTSVDIAAPAIVASQQHWEMNELPKESHTAVVQDCFEFLESANREGKRWDVVICDPPSFARNERSRPQALAAYAKLGQLSARVTNRGGLLALASCSSHVNKQAFLEANYDALGKARRKANLLADRGLPLDHPTPLAMPELRYLKFLLFQLD